MFVGILIKIRMCGGLDARVCKHRYSLDFSGELVVGPIPNRRGPSGLFSTNVLSQSL